MIITIAGKPGSGKSTTGRLLARELDLKYVYIGNIVREMAVKANMSVAEFYERIKEEPNIDHEIDEYQKKLLLSEDDIVLDSRIGFFWPVREGIRRINVFLDIDSYAAANRIFWLGQKERLADKKFNKLTHEE